MKQSYRILFCVMIVVTCLLIFPICSFAETSNKTDSVEVFVSNTVGNPKIDIKSILNDKVNL